MRSDSISADAILDKVRPVVLVVDALGNLIEARGGAGGFIGWKLEDLRGRNVLDFVAPDQLDEVATYFADMAAEGVRSVPMPMPFRVSLVGANGESELVDVIPTGCVEDGETWGWVVVLVPLALQSSPSRSLNAELSGRGRDEVRQWLTEELAYDNSWGRLVWYLVDLTDPETGPVLTAPRSEPGAAATLRAAIGDGWAPWEAAGDGYASDLTSTTFFAAGREPDAIPAALYADLRSSGWTRLTSIPVELRGETVATYLSLARTPPEDDLVVRTNSDQRISSLLDVTRLLIQRWRNQDRLVLAATSDSLTGVANRDAFVEALDRTDGPYALLYIDIDRFKDVNDRWGHAVGDQVLTEIARRISRSCHPDDLVARFGGDEFVVLLHGVDEATAADVGKRVLTTAAAPLHLTEGPEHVTLSVGMVHADSLFATGDPIDAADRAMLTAKRQGRARIVSV